MNIDHSNKSNDLGSAPDAELIDIRHLSDLQLARLGVSQLAYIKRVPTDNGGIAFAIHAADGTPLTVVADRNLAFATVRQHDMQPASVH